MAKGSKALPTMPAPVEYAMVFICEKCSKRVGGEAKHASHKIASRLKHSAKRELGKGKIRVVLTSCMDACPENSIAICLQLTRGAAPAFLQADPNEVDASSDLLLTMLQSSA